MFSFTKLTVSFGKALRNHLLISLRQYENRVSIPYYRSLIIQNRFLPIRDSFYFKLYYRGTKFYCWKF